MPLAARAVEILGRADRLGTGSGPTGYVFPTQRVGGPLSALAMEMLLRRAKMTGGVDEATGEPRPGVTLHGYRSSFRNWPRQPWPL